MRGANNNGMENVFNDAVGPLAIQSRDGDTYTVEGRLKAFNSPGPWDGYLFTEKTRFAFPHQQSILAVPDAPMLWGHGLDAELGGAILGNVVSTERRKDGIWVRSQMALAKRYSEMVDSDVVEELIETGLMGLSSGSSPHLIKFTPIGRVSANGHPIQHVDDWPVFEASITPIPRNPLNRGLVKSTQALGILERWQNQHDGAHTADTVSGGARQPLPDTVSAARGRVAITRDRIALSRISRS